jgi:hypothetical protein
MPERRYRPIAARPDGEGLGVKVTVAFDAHLKIKPNNHRSLVRYDRVTFEEDFIKVIQGVVGDDPPIPEPEDIAIVTVPPGSMFLNAGTVQWVRKL